MKDNDTVNVQWTQFGEEQKQVRKTFDPSPESIGCPGNGRQRLNEPESSGDASADLLESNHQLESRIQEICPSGSEGGAKLTLSLPLSQPWVSTLGTCKIVIHPHKALPSSALLEKHPVLRVGGAEEATGCQMNFASVVAENESVQLRNATIVTSERSDPTSALLIFDEPIETRRPDSDQ